MRAGPPLDRNLRRVLEYGEGAKLYPWKPQATYLSLVSCGDDYAIGNKGSGSFEGQWVWKLKVGREDLSACLREVRVESVGLLQPVIVVRGCRCQSITAKHSGGGLLGLLGKPPDYSWIACHSADLSRSFILVSRRRYALF